MDTRQYKIYLPLNYNDGSRIEDATINAIRDRLAERFGGTTVSPLSAPYKGPWKYGGVQYVENIVILEVIAENGAKTEQFFKDLKEQLEQELRQITILITAHPIQVV